MDAADPAIAVGGNASGAASDRVFGRFPFLALSHVVKRHRRLRWLQNRHCGNENSGARSPSHEYEALALFETPSEAGAELTPSDRAVLLQIARTAVAAAVRGERLPVEPPAPLTPALLEARACFVTLTECGELRGCIGTLQPEGPLFLGVAQNARSAALHDSRFMPVQSAEVPRLHFEISVLTQPKPLAHSSARELLAKLQPGRDGVVLRIGERRATFLPQVWDMLPDKVEFLDNLAAKAGVPPDAWRGLDASVDTYQVDSFEGGGE
ncbi:hypothetical protein DB347_23975 [Opitutaceae bacterium EW11]|nr:hypothetical protein DB347_23975 [Opitutaceae bacterium EW11]